MCCKNGADPRGPRLGSHECAAKMAQIRGTSAEVMRMCCKNGADPRGPRLRSHENVLQKWRRSGGPGVLVSAWLRKIARIAQHSGKSADRVGAALDATPP